VLVSRLLSHPSTAFYGQEARAASYTAGFGLNPGRDGTSVDSLKEDCRAKGLRVTGNKYNLMLRLLQAEHGVGNPKRAANVEVGKILLHVEIFVQLHSSHSCPCLRSAWRARHCLLNVRISASSLKALVGCCMLRWG
jgi:hypothetical protein